MLGNSSTLGNATSNRTEVRRTPAAKWEGEQRSGRAAHAEMGCLHHFLQGMKFLLPSGVYSVINNLTSLYAKTTGIPIDYDPPLGLAAYGSVSAEYRMSIVGPTLKRLAVAVAVQVAHTLPSRERAVQARTLSISNPRNRSITHDAWMITPAAVGDGVASESFMDLSQLVLYGACTASFRLLQRPQ